VAAPLNTSASHDGITNGDRSELSDSSSKTTEATERPTVGVGTLIIEAAGRTEAAHDTRLGLQRRLSITLNCQKTWTYYINRGPLG
jgi:hypothetical protein